MIPSAAADYSSFVKLHAPHFDEVVHLTSAVERPEALRPLLSRAVRRGMADPGRGMKLRAFNGTTLDYRLHKELQDRSATDGEEVFEWLSRVGGSGACIAINGLAAWDLELSSWFINRVAELGSAGGIELASRQDTYTFVSAGTGWTPFGIHEDYEPSFIFHLGPSPKRVWIWTGENRPLGVVDGAPAFAGVSFRIDESIATASEFILEPGDFLSVPAHDYHVFHNDGPSAFIGIAVHLPDAEKDVLGAVTALAARLAHQSEEHFTASELAASLGARLRQHSGELVHEWEATLARLRSAGFIDKPKSAALDSTPPARRLYRVAHPAVLQQVRDTVYVRGSGLRLSLSSERIERLCAFLQSGEWVDGTRVGAEIGISSRQGNEILARLHHLGGMVTN